MTLPWAPAAAIKHGPRGRQDPADDYAMTCHASLPRSPVFATPTCPVGIVVGEQCCLNNVDEIRDEYGLPAGQPRHLDLSSGKP